MRHLMEDLYDEWLKKFYPWWWPLNFIVALIVIALFVTSVVFIWTWPEVWWKMLISAIGFLILVRLIFGAIHDHLFKEFMSGDKRL